MFHVHPRAVVEQFEIAGQESFDDPKRLVHPGKLTWNLNTTGL